MTRALALALALVVIVAPRAAAQVDSDTWVDPTLEAAVADADLIVLGECVEVARAGAATYKVTRTFKGPPRDGRAVAVVGFDNPGEFGRHAVPVGDRAYLLLRSAGKDATARSMSVPTPTFGRFPLHASGDVVASFSDTFVRVPVPPERWERVLESLVRGTPDPKLLEEARAALAAKEPDSTELYVALEALALFGDERDRAPVMALLDDPRWAEPPKFRLRIAAANALTHLGGAGAANRLLALIEKDPLDVVKSAAAQGLRDVLRRLQATDAAAVNAVTRRLAALAPGARSEAVRFGSAHDRRANELDGLLSAILKTLADVDPQAGVPVALAALERVDDIDALMAGLSYFSALRDPAHAGAIAQRMRAKDAEDVYCNSAFARTLEGLTGQPLGDDREAWLRWARAQGQLPAEQGPPVGPPAPQDGRGERR